MSFTDEFEDSLQAKRFRHRSILLFVILATLPFYIVGAILLGIAPDEAANVSENNPSQLPPNASTQEVDDDATATATLSGSATVTLNPTQGLGTLPSTPFQFRTPTRFVLPTQTQVPPTATTAPSLTLAPTATSQPSATSTPQGNRPPVFTTAPPDQGLAVGETVTVNLSFSDPDGNPVVVSAISNNSSVARIEGATLTPPTSFTFNITGLSVGNAVITVTLNDDNGGITENIIAVTVTAANNNPVFDSEPGPVTLNQGATSMVTLMFSDPNGDTVTFTAVSANTGIATTANASATAFNVTGVAAGSTTITITLNDGRGGSATRTINVTVNAAANANPVFNVEPLDIIVTQGDSELVLLQISDPNGDPITLTVTPANLTLATVIIDGSSFTVQGNTVGTTTAVIRLQDGNGGSAQRTVNLSVVAP
jgi:hypothetical protein